MNRKDSIIIFLAVAFGLIRTQIHPSKPDLVDVFKDLVHVYMGCLLVLSYPRLFGLIWHPDLTCRWVFWLLNALEVTVAIVSRI